MRMSTTRTILFFLLTAAAVLARPATPKVTVGLTDTAPAIDGSITEATWDDAAVLGNFVELDMSALSPTTTEVRLLRTATHLYIGAVCREPNIEGLHTLMDRRDSSVWKDDCIEIFLDPGRTTTDFQQIISNAKGTLFDRRVPGSAAWDADVQVATTIGEDRWTVEMAIPFADLGGAPANGDVWGFNVGRERYAGDEGALSAWAPTYGKFDRVENYGIVAFGSRSSTCRIDLPERFAFGPNLVTITTPTGTEPAIEVERDWPADVQRTWEVPKASLSRDGRTYRALVPVLDGSETALTVRLGQGDTVGFRRSIPILISPKPHIADLSRRVLALRQKLVDGDLPFSDEAAELVAAAEAEMTRFLTAVASRESPMSESEWATAAAEQRRLARDLASLVYTLWPDDPLKPFSANDMPDSLKPDPLVRLSACGNEREAAAINLTNLGDQPLTGRLSVTDLELAQSQSQDTGLMQQDNLLTNGDFSVDADADGIPDGWRRTALEKASYSLQPERDGNAFVLHAEDGGQAVFRQTVRLQPGTQYTLRVDMSAEDLRADSGFCHLINEGWTWSKTLRPRTPTSSRMSFSTSFRAPSAEFFQVVLRLAEGSGGTIRYHAATLVEGGIQNASFSSARVIRFHDVAFEDLRVGTTVADPLPRMDGSRGVDVPSGQSRQYWMSVDTADLPPGHYSASVAFHPDNTALPTKTIPVDLEVLPVRLPERMPIAVFNWDYAGDEHYVRDLVEHRTNTLLMNTHFPIGFREDGAMITPVDWTGYDQLLFVKLRHAREQGGIVMFSYGIIRDFHRRFSSAHGWKFMDERWQRAFKQWVLEFERHVRDDVGMEYDEYAVQLWDEATHENADLTVQAGTFMRSFAPAVRTCMDGAQNVAEITALDPVVDLWIPHQNTLYHHKEAEQIRALYKQLMARGEPVWTYTCSTNMKALSPLDYYRLKEWRVWELGLQGSCYWAYNSWRGDPWDDFDGTISDCGTVYDGPEGPVTSRRWESTLDGREDYLCLHLTREAGKRLNRERADAVEADLDRLTAQALAAANDPKAFRAVRAELLALLEQTVAENPPALTTPPTFEREGSTIRCTVKADRPVAATIYWRVPGAAEWQRLGTSVAPTPSFVLEEVPPKRPVEWYLVFTDEAGATGSRLSGLQPQGWIAP